MKCKQFFTFRRRSGLNAGQDIGYVTIALKHPNKVKIIYETEQTKSALNEIMR